MGPAPQSWVCAAPCTPPLSSPREPRRMLSSRPPSPRAPHKRGCRRRRIRPNWRSTSASCPGTSAPSQRARLWVDAPTQNVRARASGHRVLGVGSVRSRTRYEGTGPGLLAEAPLQPRPKKLMSGGELVSHPCPGAQAAMGGTGRSRGLKVVVEHEVLGVLEGGRGP
jgi:hypothetical protein